jgi:hypothetical protein
MNSFSLVGVHSSRTANPMAEHQALETR